MERGNFICFDSLGSSEGVGFAGSISAPGAEHEDREVHDRRATRRCSPTTATRSCPARARSACSRSAATSRSATTRTRRSRDATFLDDQRRALVGPRRLRERRGRRHDHAARPGLGRHQLRRREDLPRGGRRGGEAAPRGRRLPRRRRARRALRRSGHRGRVAAPGRRTRSADELGAALEALARFKRPRRFVIVDEVVRGPNGKADYKWAKARQPRPRPRIRATRTRAAPKLAPVVDVRTTSSSCRSSDLGEHVAELRIKQVLAVDRDLGAAVLRVDDGVADREVDRDQLAAVARRGGRGRPRGPRPAGASPWRCRG